MENRSNQEGFYVHATISLLVEQSLDVSEVHKFSFIRLRRAFVLFLAFRRDEHRFSFLQVSFDCFKIHFFYLFDFYALLFVIY